MEKLDNDQITVAIQEEVIDVGALIQKMKHNSAGALSIFLGTTRDHFDNRKVKKLFYEAHPTMAFKKLKEIAEYCYTKYGLLKIALIHRIGEVVYKHKYNIASNRREYSYYFHIRTS